MLGQKLPSDFQHCPGPEHWAEVVGLGMEATGVTLIATRELSPVLCCLQ